MRSRQAPGCGARPSFGEAGGARARARFCGTHAPAGAVNIYRKTCEAEAGPSDAGGAGAGGCPRQASYGAPGARKGSRCRAHALPGMVHLWGACYLHLF